MRDIIWKGAMPTGAITLGWLNLYDVRTKVRKQFASIGCGKERAKFDNFQVTERPRGHSSPDPSFDHRPL